MKKIILSILFTIIALAGFAQHQYGKQVTVSGTDTYTTTIVNPSPPPNYTGLVIHGVKFPNTNTGASTFNVTNISGAGAVAIRYNDGDSWEPLPAGKIDINTVYKLSYNGSYFQLESGGGAGGSQTLEQVLTTGNHITSPQAIVVDAGAAFAIESAVETDLVFGLDENRVTMSAPNGTGFELDAAGLINIITSNEVTLNTDPGTAGQVFTSQGTGNAPTWEDASGSTIPSSVEKIASFTLSTSDAEKTIFLNSGSAIQITVPDLDAETRDYWWAFWVVGSGGGDFDPVAETVTNTAGNYDFIAQYGPMYLYYYSASNSFHLSNGTAGGAGLSDADYGDITVSGTGTIMNIDAGVVTGTEIATGVALAGNPTTTTQSAGNNSTRLATTAYADALVADGTITNGVTGIAPSQDDVFDALALKAPLSAPTFTTSITGPYSTNGGLLYTNGSGLFAQTGAGSSTTVLHGGTSPGYSAVSLTADVTGVLPLANQALEGTNTSTSLTDAGTVTITGPKHTLTSDEATITWTLSQTQDFQTTDIILNATSTTWTFPANALCVVEGLATGNNIAVVSGAVSGDHLIMSIYKDGTNYRIAIKNFGQ